jgi:hypothetical protein
LKVLVNGLGIRDSGGLAVLEKLLKECLEVDSGNKFIFILTNSPVMSSLAKNYENFDVFEFKLLKDKGYIYRLYVENREFKKIVSQCGIDLIYNFTGTRQLFTNTPQLIKIHNLLFFSKKLDNLYKSKYQYILWFKHIFFKRIMFNFMLNRSKHIEIQASHVQTSLLDFIDTRERLFYVKSDNDISDEVFHVPKVLDSSKKIKFLYVVGPHFEYLHKNMTDFTKAMLAINDKGVDFEINITLTNEQLSNSRVWDVSLNSKTNFLGYIDCKQKMADLFCKNTILISTSVIETLGLHVIEGIKNGVITIAPDEEYAHAVYGDNMFKYVLFNEDSLVSVIMSIINSNVAHTEKILSIQDDLRQNEMRKFSSILNVFDEVLNVHK